MITLIPASRARADAQAALMKRYEEKRDYLFSIINEKIEDAKRRGYFSTVVYHHLLDDNGFRALLAKEVEDSGYKTARVISTKNGLRIEWILTTP